MDLLKFNWLQYLEQLEQLEQRFLSIYACFFQSNRAVRNVNKMLICLFECHDAVVRGVEWIFIFQCGAHGGAHEDKKATSRC